MLIVATIVMVNDKSHHRPVRPLARLAFTVGVIASVAANIAAAQPTIGARIIDAWPAIALLLVVEMLARRPAPSADAAEVRPAPVAAVGGATAAPVGSAAGLAAVPAELSAAGSGGTAAVPPLLAATAVSPGAAAAVPPAATPVFSRRGDSPRSAGVSRHLRPLDTVSTPHTGDTQSIPSGSLDAGPRFAQPADGQRTMPGAARPVDKLEEPRRLTEVPAARQPEPADGSTPRTAAEVPPLDPGVTTAEGPPTATSGSYVPPPADAPDSGGTKVPPVTTGSVRRPAAVTRHLAQTIMHEEPHLSRTELANRLGLSPRRLREILAA